MSLCGGDSFYFHGNETIHFKFGIVSQSLNKSYTAVKLCKTIKILCDPL